MEKNPQTGEAWKDRYGIAFGKGLKKAGNIEAFLSYSKLHRTGRLLRGLSSKATGREIILSNRVPYAELHEEGGKGATAKVKAPYVRGGASTVITGGNVTARPFMNPSKKILVMPKTLLGKKMKAFGW